MFLNEGHHSNTVNVIPSHLKIVLLLPSSLLASIKNLYFLWAYNNIKLSLKTWTKLCVFIITLVEIKMARVSGLF